MKTPSGLFSLTLNFDSGSIYKVKTTTTTTKYNKINGGEESIKPVQRKLKYNFFFVYVQVKCNLISKYLCM